ncbi:cation efflux system protein [Escherichia coli]|uniref:Cation efflux system protein n=1 Tax=Escherichia coli TaxID=562 RepID=A0A376UE05_ECOLX|nr:cation efflux system protein [Escherichia coli]
MPLCRLALPGLSTRCNPLTVGDKVQKGTPLLDLTIPDWVEAQSEYLLLRETGGTATQTEGILERLRLAGMPEADIRRLIGHAKNPDSLYAQSAH